MKAFIGVFGLLTVAAIIGVISVIELRQMTDAEGGPGAVISATTSGATQQPEIQQQVQDSVEVAVNQAHPIQSSLDDD
jgi:hypothetical protein